MIRLVAAGIALVASQTQASYTISVPGVGEMPHYFSATNCRISAVANPPMVVPDDFNPPPPNPPIVEAWLYVGGELTYHYDWAALPVPRPAKAPSLAISVMFDSTRFADGQNLTVEFRVKDDNGAIFTSSNTAPVYNKATLYGRYDLDENPLNWYNGSWARGDPQDNTWACVDGVAGVLSTIGYSIQAQVTSQGWSADSLLQNLQPCTLFLVNTHGSVAEFASDWNDYWYHYPNDYPSDMSRLAESIWPLVGQGRTFVIKPVREAAFGTGQLPPFNSGSPPITLAYVAACHCGADNDFAEAFLFPQGNYYTGYSQYPEDQSYCGYAGLTDCSDGRPIATEFFGWLEDHYTVHQARIHLYNVCGTDDSATYDGYLRVWGDFHTRIKGVYTGASEETPPATWWR